MNTTNPGTKVSGKKTWQAPRCFQFGVEAVTASQKGAITHESWYNSGVGHFKCPTGSLHKFPQSFLSSKAGCYNNLGTRAS